MSGPRGFKVTSHVLYADDIMFFCRGSKCNLMNLRDLFRQYSEASGQFLSPNKCRFYTGIRNSRRTALFTAILGFHSGQLPFFYLGVPIFIGKPKKVHLQPIADKVKLRLALWKGSLLSIMGRTQLVKSIIHGMLVYSFHVYKWPISLLKTMDRWISNFISSGNIYKRKLVTVAWHKICTTFSEGGLGLRSVRAINKTGSFKLCWEFLSSNYHWAGLSSARFLKNNVPSTYYIKSSIWLAIKNSLPSLLQHCAWRIGDGCSIRFWTDTWLDTSVVAKLEIPPDMHHLLKARVSDFMDNQAWSFPDQLAGMFPELVVDIMKIEILASPTVDQLVWSETDSGFMPFKDMPICF